MRNELIIRITKGLDFLCHMQKSDGSFIAAFIKGRATSEPTKIMYHLQATSLLYSCAEYLGQDHLKVVADKAFDYIQPYSFLHNDEACLIFEGESYGYWNALMGIVHFKRGQSKQAIPFINSTKRCFVNATSLAQYEPGTTSEKFNSKMPGPVGVITAALLRAGMVDEAVYSINHFIKGKRYDYFDSWALRLMHDKLIEEGSRPALVDTYFNKAILCHQLLSRVNPKSLTSLVAATTHQSFLAWADKSFVHKDLCTALLHRQIELQNLDTLAGGFVRTETQPDIYLEYLIHNITAYLEFIKRYENDATVPADIYI